MARAKAAQSHGGFFYQATIAPLGQSKDAFQDAEDVLDLGSHFGLRRVFSAFFFVHMVLELRMPKAPILRVRSHFMNRVRLALIAAVAPHLSNGVRCLLSDRKARSKPAATATAQPHPSCRETAPARSYGHTSRNSPPQPVSAVNIFSASALHFMKARGGSGTCAEIR